MLLYEYLRAFLFYLDFATENTLIYIYHWINCEEQCYEQCSLLAKVFDENTTLIILGAIYHFLPQKKNLCSYLFVYVCCKWNFIGFHLSLFAVRISARERFWIPNDWISSIERAAVVAISFTSNYSIFDCVKFVWKQIKFNISCW